jgi:hypothetical protein
MCLQDLSLKVKALLQEGAGQEGVGSGAVVSASSSSIRELEARLDGLERGCQRLTNGQSKWNAGSHHGKPGLPNHV